MKMDFILSTTTDYAMKLALQDCLDKAQEDLFNDYIVIVPETKTLLAERFLLDHHKNHSFANIYIYSFNRLLEKIQTQKVFPVSKEAGVMIVRNLIMELEENLVCYKKTAGTVGFAENIYDTISQLKTSGISPIELSLSAEKVSTALQIKLKDIALIYDAYESKLGEELADSNDKLVMLEKQAELSDFVKNANLYVVGFESLTASATNVIKSFVKNATSVVVSAGYMHPKKTNSHIADNDVYARYQQIADSLKIKYEPYFRAQTLKGDFLHIRENLFAYPLNKKKTSGNVKIFGAPNYFIEARRVASQIKQAVLENRCRYKDNAIYVCSNEQTEFIISALKEFEIPHFVSVDYQFENHPFFTFIKGLFSVIKRNLEMQDVLTFSRNQLLYLDKDKLDDFDNYVHKYAINYSKFLKPFNLGDNESGQFKNAEEIRQEIVNIVSKFAGIYNANMTISELVDSLKVFLKDFNMPWKLEILESLQNKQQEIPSAYATRQVMTKADEVLKMLKQFLGEQKVDLNDFYILLISGLQSSDISLLPLGIDQVQVVNSQEGLYEIKNLYVVGASDGLFPLRTQDLGLIQDSEINSLEGISEKKIEPTIKSINRRERYKVFELLQFPTEKLSLSYSEHALNGEELKVSSLVQMVSNLFKTQEDKDYEIDQIYSSFDDLAVTQEDKEQLALSLGSKQVMQNYLGENLSSFKNGYDYNAGFDFINSLYHSLEKTFSEEIKEKFDNINNEHDYENIFNANQLFFKKGTTSISELEKYFACPFKHFADYGLKLKEKEMANMKALDVGDILHLVAEKFVKYASQDRIDNVEKFAVNTLKQVLENEKYSVEENKVLISIMENEVKRLCKALYDELKVSEFKPTDTESWFGKDGKYKGIIVSDEPKIELVGKIDRIDKTEEFHRIIDYKTGKIDAGLDDVYYGVKIQLPVYLSALRKETTKPAGVLYFPIRNEFAKGKDKANELYKMKGFILNDPKAILKMDKTYSYESPKSDFISPELKTAKTLQASGVFEFSGRDNLVSDNEIESMARYVRAASRKATKEILDGFIMPSPFAKSKTNKPCDYCEYRNVCGILSNEYASLREPSAKNVKDFFKGDQKWEE